MEIIAYGNDAERIVIIWKEVTVSCFQMKFRMSITCLTYDIFRRIDSVSLGITPLNQFCKQSSVTAAHIKDFIPISNAYFF